MELARLAVQAQAAVVVDAVGDVGRLLDLGDEAAAADGVDASGREEEHVAGMHVVAGQHLGDGAVRDALLVFLGRDFLGHAGEQVRARLRIDHIPHFGLSLGAVVPHGGQLVVRMDLHGQVGEGVDELDQQRELVAGVGIHVLAHETALVLLHEIRDGAALEGAVRDHGLVSFHAGQFPAFADVLLFGFHALVGGDLLAAPDDGLEDGFEFQRIHRLSGI